MAASRRQASSKRPAFTTQEAFTLLLAQLPDLFTTGLLEQLRLTVDLYVQRITPTEKERDAKRTLFNAFADFLRRAMHDRIAISVAGSTAYEVDAKGSDLDVVLLTNWGAPPYVLQAIVRYLQMTQAVQNSAARSTWPLKNVSLQLVDSARVPVLTVTTPKGLVCDVSVNTLNSVKHTEFFKRVISVNLALRPMMRLLKYWAKVRRLPTMREGGLPGIVWMLLAVYFGSCPQSVFLNIDRQAAAWPDTHLVADLYPAMSPLVSSLFRFFRLAGTRQTLARTISCTGQYCKSKNPAAIVARVSSQQNSLGVWDEVVSVEDPAVTSEPALPANAIWSEDEGTEAECDTGGFQPGSATDLAAKMSSATWLIYMLELRRGAQIFSRLFAFINDARSRVKHLPSLVGASGARAALGTADSESVVSAHDYIARHFRRYIALLFEESTTDRFTLPGCDDKLRHLAAELTPPLNSEAEAHGKSHLDLTWEAPLLTARGMPQMTFRPFCACCSTPRMDFGVVLLHTRVHLLRITSICTDWTSWWTKDFLSRRDVRSIIHGTLHEIIAPSAYLKFVSHDASKYTYVDMPATGFPSDQPCEPLEKDVTPYPHLVVPVRRARDATPVELLFRPCDFICRLKAFEVPSTPLPRSGVPDEVFFMERDETAYLQTLSSLASAAPWFHLGDDFGSSRVNVGNKGADFQPAASGCVQCGVYGDSMDALSETAAYECPEGAFQKGPLSANKRETCQAAWRRWEEHARGSVSRHEGLGGVSVSPRADVFVVPELHRASHLLAATIDGLQQRLAPKETPGSRRTVSLPDRFESKDEVAEEILLRPSSRAPKREELLRYVPPSKRQAKNEGRPTDTRQTNSRTRSKRRQSKQQQHNEHVVTLDASRRLLQSALKGATTYRPPPPLARVDSAHSSTVTDTAVDLNGNDDNI